MLSMSTVCRGGSAIFARVFEGWILAFALLGVLSVPVLASPQSQVQRLYEEAQAARSRGDLARAEQGYREVVRLAPNLARAYHNLGIVYFLERKYQDSATALEKALELAPRLAEAETMLGLAYYQLDKPAQAAAAFQVALRLNPADTNALLYLAKSQIQTRDYRAAVKTLEKLSLSRPSDPDLLYSLSLAHMKLMLQAVNRLGEVAPNSYQFWLLMAQDAQARGDDQGAIRAYRGALRVKPDAVGAHYGFGSVLARTGNYDEAAEQFSKELEINPNDSLALWKLGELTLRTNPQQARGYLRRAVDLNPDFPQAVLAYGRALARTGEIEKAIEQFRRVVRLAPEEESVHYHLANLYRRLGRAEEATRELAQFEELAGRKSERTRQRARQLVEMSLAAQETTEEPEPGFSSSRDPIHP